MISHFGLKNDEYLRTTWIFQSLELTANRRTLSVWAANSRSRHIPWRDAIRLRQYKQVVDNCSDPIKQVNRSIATPLDGSRLDRKENVIFPDDIQWSKNSYKEVGRRI